MSFFIVQQVQKKDIFNWKNEGFIKNYLVLKTYQSILQLPNLMPELDLHWQFWSIEENLLLNRALNYLAQTIWDIEIESMLSYLKCLKDRSHLLEN